MIKMPLRSLAFLATTPFPLFMPIPLAHYTHNLDPIAIRFPKSFFIEGIYWYGLAYFAGFMIAAYLLQLYYKKNQSDLNPPAQSQLLMYLILGALLGGRLGYWLLYQGSSLMADPASLFKTWRSGMSIHGGFVGVGLALLYFSKKHKYNFFKLSDTVVTLAPAGMFLGRIANFINGELWGRITQVSWGVIFPASAPYPSYPLGFLAARHPSQLYGALCEGLVLLAFSQWRFWSSSKQTPGLLTGEFLMAYACLRSFVECFREPDASLLLGLSRGQFYSLFLLGLGLGIRLYARSQQPARQTAPQKLQSEEEVFSSSKR